MSEILDGWEPRYALEQARKDQDVEALLDFKALDALRHAVAECEERGLCLYCGSKKRAPLTGMAPRCYCRADD